MYLFVFDSSFLLIFIELAANFIVGFAVTFIVIAIVAVVNATIEPIRIFAKLAAVALDYRDKGSIHAAVTEIGHVAVCASSKEGNQCHLSPVTT